MIYNPAWEGSHVRASSEEGILGVDRVGGSVGLSSCDLVWSFEFPVAGDVRDAVFLKEMRDSARERLDGAVFCLHDLLEVELDASNFDAARFEVFVRHVVKVRILQKRLGWNAADVQTRAAESVSLFDANSLEAELSSLDGGYVAAGTAADDRQVGVICCQSSA